MIQCLYCGSRVKPEDRTCVKCGAPPPYDPEPEEETQLQATWGEWAQNVRDISVLMVRERPDTLPLNLQGTILRFMEIRPIGVAVTDFRWHVPRGAILSYLEVHAVPRGLICAAKLTANYADLIFDFPQIELPLSLNLMIDTGLVPELEVCLRVPPAQFERQLFIYRRMILRDFGGRL